jgi:hypothetical protein
MTKYLPAFVLIAFAVLAAGCNRAPVTPAALVLPATAMISQPCTLTCVTTDPSGKDLAYRFDWDDGDTSGWTAFLASGVACTVIHAWDRNGTYAVRGQAKNTDERLSGWFAPDTIRVDSVCGLR